MPSNVTSDIIKILRKEDEKLKSCFSRIALLSLEHKLNKEIRVAHKVGAGDVTGLIKARNMVHKELEKYYEEKTKVRRKVKK